MIVGPEHVADDGVRQQLGGALEHPAGGVARAGDPVGAVLGEDHRAGVRAGRGHHPLEDQIESAARRRDAGELAHQPLDRRPRGRVRLADRQAQGGAVEVDRVAGLERVSRAGVERRTVAAPSPTSIASHLAGAVARQKSAD